MRATTKETLRSAGYYDLFADIYKMLQVYPEQGQLTEEQWGDLITAAGKLKGKYFGTQAEALAKELILATVGEFERIDKKRAVCTDIQNDPSNNLHQ